MGSKRRCHACGGGHDSGGRPDSGSHDAGGSRGHAQARVEVGRRDAKGWRVRGRRDSFGPQKVPVGSGERSGSVMTRVWWVGGFVVSGLVGDG